MVVSGIRSGPLLVGLSINTIPNSPPERNLTTDF